MLREANSLFACWLFLFGFQSRMTYLPLPELTPFPVSPSVSEEPGSFSDLSITDIIPNEFPCHGDLKITNLYLSQQKRLVNNSLKRKLGSFLTGPDLVVKELNVNEDFELSFILSNAGEEELRKGRTLRIRVFINGQRVSEFDHFIAEPLKPHFENHCIIDPPYRIRVNGNSRVKVVIGPKHPDDDVRIENNMIERTFAIIPFKIESEVSQEFPFFLKNLRSKENRQGDKIKMEVRWDGGGAPLRLSLKGARHLKEIGSVSGKSPLQLEVPFRDEKKQKGKAWRLSIANLMKEKAVGFLIIQSP